MKSPKVKGIGEVVTEYGAKVMKIFKKGLLQRSLFDFYGDVKANAIRVKESSSVPQTPVDKDGGVVYVKNSDGKLYYKSNEVSEIELSASDANTQNTTTLSFVDSSNDILLRNTTGGAGSGTDDIKFVAGSNVTLTHTDADNITIASTDTNTTYSIQDGELSQNNFTDADHTKLNNIEDNATADQTKGDIDSLGIAATTAVSLTAGDKTIDGNLALGGDDGDVHYITRVAHSDDGGGRLYVQAGTGGGTNKPGGSLLLQGGASTGNANGGSIVFGSSAAGSSGSSVNSVGVLGSITSEGNLSIEGDLTVKGNDIKDDDGTTCITFDSSGNTTVANTLNATLTGNVTGDVTGNAATATALQTARNIGGVSFNGTANINLPGVNETGDQDTSGNAATATALTTGNKDITGTLGVTELITSKQRHLLRCGFYGNASRMYLPFNYGGTFENTSTAGYSEYGAVIMPCDGYVESVIIRSENACGNSSVTILVASDGTEVPSLSPGSFVSPTVNMSADDTSYKFTGFVNQGGTSNSFSAGDVIMIAFDPTSSSYDTTATAVLVFDWNNQL